MPAVMRMQNYDVEPSYNNAASLTAFIERSVKAFSKQDAQYFLIIAGA